MKPPARYKAREDYTVDEIAHTMAAAKRGEDERVETDEFKRYHADVLRASGLSDLADATEPDAVPDIAEMTTEQHFESQRRPG
jgi:hypothetical protein